jgi:homoserine kinase type II
MMDTVYLVHHWKYRYTDEEEVKFIGVYSTEELAQEAVERLKKQPGFCDTPEAFFVEGCRLNQDHWTEGYVTEIVAAVSRIQRVVAIIRLPHPSMAPPD